MPNHTFPTITTADLLKFLTGEDGGWGKEWLNDPEFNRLVQLAAKAPHHYKQAFVDRRD